MAKQSRLKSSLRKSASPLGKSRAKSNSLSRSPLAKSGAKKGKKALATGPPMEPAALYEQFPHLMQATGQVSEKTLLLSMGDLTLSNTQQTAKNQL